VAVLSRDGIVVESNATAMTVTATDPKKYWRYSVVVHPAGTDASSTIDTRVELIGSWDDGYIKSTTTADMYALFRASLSLQLGGAAISPLTK